VVELIVIFIRGEKEEFMDYSWYDISRTAKCDKSAVKKRLSDLDTVAKIS